MTDMMVAVSVAAGLVLGACAADADSAAKERRILASIKGTPREREAPRDILVNKPDYVVFVPKQPLKLELRNPRKRATHTMTTFRS